MQTKNYFIIMEREQEKPEKPEKGEKEDDKGKKKKKFRFEKERKSLYS